MQISKFLKPIQILALNQNFVFSQMFSNLHFYFSSQKISTFQQSKQQQKLTSQQCIDLENKYGCQSIFQYKYEQYNLDYHPIPVVLARGQGVYVFDVENKKYFDFLSAYSAVNQGHCHPKIFETMTQQAKQVTLVSRAFYNNQLGLCEKFLSETFGFERVLMMNGGVEGGESALKIARKWGYDVKKIPEDKARIIFAKGNFWGRTLAACASSDDLSRFQGFGPFHLNFDLVEYDNLKELEEKFKMDGNRIAALMIEPIQGEKGVIIPSQDYLKKIKQLCTQYNILLILDEIQTGLGRTGKMLACDYEQVKPDILILGKALSGGYYPISAVLANNNVMGVITPGTHGSTYGGNHMASAICQTAVKVIIEEGMAENSRLRGQELLKGLKQIVSQFDFVKEVRGRGLFVALEFKENCPKTAWDLCMKLKDLGLLAKPTHDDTIRFSPPLIITKSQIEKSLEIISEGLKKF